MAGRRPRHGFSPSSSIRPRTSSAVPVTVVDPAAPRRSSPMPPIGGVDVAAVADVDVEVALVLRALVDHREPLLAAREVGDGVATVQLVRGVVGEGTAGSGGGQHPRRRHLLTRLEHCAPIEEDDPVEGARLKALEGGCGEHAVVVLGLRPPLRPKTPTKIGTSIGRAPT